MKKVKKAVIAVAGSGTRFLPATKSMPKEMLPIVDKPAIQILVEELIEGGIEDVIFVTRWDKKPLEDHFDHSFALEYELKKGGKEKRLAEIKRISDMARFVYVRQDPQYGNGVPALSAASLVDDEPFVYCFGDDLIKSKVSFTKKMIEDYDKCECPIYAAQVMPDDQLYRYGVAKLKEGTNDLEYIVEKPKTAEEAPSNLVTFGRMILNQEILDILKETPIGQGNELWLVDAVTEYIKRGNRVVVKKVEEGEWLTMGDPLNWMKANLKYAFEREDIGGKLKDFIKDYIKD